MTILKQHSDLHAEIQRAFSSNVRVDSREIARGESIEARMVGDFLSPRSWIDLDADALIDYDSRADLSALIAFLSSKGFRYYLPAILLFIIDHNAKAGNLIDALISKLASGSDEYGPNAFTRAQQLAVSRFLSYLKGAHPNDKLMGNEIDRALSIWNTIESSPK